MKSNHRKTRIGFTLVELLVVIAIMLILASIGVGSFSYVQERQNKEKAKVQMALLSKAIEEYKLDMGKYPGTTENPAADGDFSKELYTALFYEGYQFSENPNRPDPNNSLATKIYVPELDPTTSKQGWIERSNVMTTAPLFIIDPWGANYRYRKGANAENPDFDLWSMGKDKDDDKDDLRNF
jgi:general secretion pathway protein G